VTKRELNNSRLPAGTSFGLPRADILRGRKHFQRLFEQPINLLTEKHFTLRFYVSVEREYACKMGFIVPRRLGKASQRNYVKRLLREAYRLNRHNLIQILRAVSTGFYGAFMAKTVAVDFETVENEVINLLGHAIKHLTATRQL
jgi:ribonuclease P protein component